MTAHLLLVESSRSCTTLGSKRHSLALERLAGFSWCSNLSGAGQLAILVLPNQASGQLKGLLEDAWCQYFRCEVIPSCCLCLDPLVRCHARVVLLTSTKSQKSDGMRLTSAYQAFGKNSRSPPTERMILASILTAPRPSRVHLTTAWGSSIPASGD